MKIVIADGDAAALHRLERLLGDAAPSAEIVTFRNPEEVPAHLEKNDAQIAFLGVPAGKCGSIGVARKIRAIRPECNIVFCADKAEHALDAFGIGASDYLMKPLTPEKLAHAMAQLRNPLTLAVGEGELFVRTFGEFEVFYCGKPLPGLTKRAKELFAFLVDRQGADCDAHEVSAVLFYNMSDVNFRIACKNLREALEKVGKGEILIRRWGKVAVDMEAIVCDSVEYLKGNPAAAGLYKGEYMEQYPWAAAFRKNALSSQGGL